MVSVPQERQHPRICSNCLPMPPICRKKTPHLQQKRDPVRRTFSWTLFVYPCDSSSSDPAGKRKRRGPSKPAAATEEPWVKHCHGQQRKQTMTPPWTVQTNISKESSEDATSAEQERRLKPHTSWSGQSQARKTEKYQRRGKVSIT